MTKHPALISAWFSFICWTDQHKRTAEVFNMFPINEFFSNIRYFQHFILIREMDVLKIWTSLICRVTHFFKSMPYHYICYKLPISIYMNKLITSTYLINTSSSSTIRIDVLWKRFYMVSFTVAYRTKRLFPPGRQSV